MTSKVSLPRRVVAEALGSALLLATVVGSGIMAETLSRDVGLALLASSLATGAMLVALIVTLAPISGAHFNPAVTLCAAWQRELSWRDVPGYLIAQTAGAMAGVAAANTMFGKPALFASTRARHGSAQLLAEAIATFGLLAVIWGSSRRRPTHTPYVVAGYIVAAYWFTSSTSFANPAITLARAATDTFAGIRPGDVPGFVGAQLVGALAATALLAWLIPRDAAVEADLP